jgi:hypothetical protein
MPGRVLAHGIGGRSDLPLDAGAAVVGGMALVAVSAVVLLGLWRRPLRTDRELGLPRALAGLADGHRTRGLLRALALAAFALVLAAAFAGPADGADNLAPWALYVTLWVGLVPVGLLLGPAYRVVSPLRTLDAARRRLLRRLGRPAASAPRRLPAGVGVWPGAVALAGFAWLELVAPGRDDPRLVGAVLAGSALVHLVAAARYGPDWFAAADPFEVWSEQLARMAPLARGRERTLVLRNPLVGLATARHRPGQAAVLVVLTGATGYDGLTRSLAWQQAVGGSVAAGTAGLAGAVAVVGVAWTAATWLGVRLSGVRGHRLWPEVARYAPSLAPIAAGYAVAHYFSLLVVEGQRTVLLATDPLGTGADLLGLAGRTVDYGVVGVGTVAAVQVNAVVLGHVAATAAGHDTALRSPGDPRRAGLPVLVVMVALSGLALVLLLG